MQRQLTFQQLLLILKRKTPPPSQLSLLLCAVTINLTNKNFVATFWSNKR